MSISVQQFGICILFHEKLDQTIECIKTFMSSGTHIYVLNNNSSSHASCELSAFCSNFSFVHRINLPLNLGVSIGRNILIQNTQEPWLFFVDNDIQIGTVDWVQNLTHHIEANPEIEVFIPRLYNIHEKRYVPHLLMSLENNDLKTQIADKPRTNLFPGGAAIVSRQLFNRLGLYDQEMMIGLEDWELGLRAIKTGLPIKALSIKDILLVHDHRKARDEESKKAIQIRYNDQIISNSYKRFVEKHKVNWEHDYQPWLNEQLKRMLAAADDKPPHSIFGSKKAPHTPTSCNLHFCNSKTADQMTVALVAKILEIYPSVTSFHVMGECDPLLCPQICEILDYIKSQQRTVGINTNGVNAEKLLQLNYKPDYISLQLYGWDTNSTTERYVLDLFKTTLDNYFKLKEVYQNVGFSFTLSKNNYQDLNKILILCDHLKPAFLHLKNYVPESLCPEQVQKIITANDCSVIDHIEKAVQNRPYLIHTPAYLTFDQPLTNGTSICKSYQHLITVDEAGNIGGCNGPILPNSCCGNIFTNTDPYRTSEMRRLRSLAQKRLFPHPECLYCCNKLI